jgi:hypothetical protein
MKHIILMLFTLSFGNLLAMEMSMIQLPDAQELRVRFLCSGFKDFENDMNLSKRFALKKENHIVIADQINDELTKWIKEKHDNDSFILADHEQLLENMEKDGYFNKYLPTKPPSRAMQLFEMLQELQPKK